MQILKEEGGEGGKGGGGGRNTCRFCCWWWRVICSVLSQKMDLRCLLSVDKILLQIFFGNLFYSLDSKAYVYVLLNSVRHIFSVALFCTSKATGWPGENSKLGGTFHRFASLFPSFFFACLFKTRLEQIMLAEGEDALALLPTRFRKLIWVKRGDYLITSTSVGEFETSAGEAGKVSQPVSQIFNQLISQSVN